MKVGLIGLSLSGKTSVFRAVTGLEAALSHTLDEHTTRHMGVVPVPDPRLERLGDIFHREKRVPATVELVDQAGIHPGAADRAGAFDATARAVDAFALVVRAFAEEAVPHPLAGVNPRRDLETLVQELLLADLEVVERRLERVEKDLARGKRELDREHRVLLRCREALGEERGVRSLTWSHEEDELLRGFAFLTAKPALVVANVGEEGLPAEEEGTLREAAASRRMPFATLEARLEVELSGLEEAERRAFRESYGLADTARDLLVRTAYEALDSHTFYTAGEHEVRAWALRRGGTALEAAGTVHTDMARGFIRAEVIHIDEFLACGSVAAAREKGLYRLEGKDYVLKDGDLVYFRFSK